MQRSGAVIRARGEIRPRPQQQLDDRRVFGVAGGAVEGSQTGEGTGVEFSPRGEQSRNGGAAAEPCRDVQRSRAAVGPGLQVGTGFQQRCYERWGVVLGRLMERSPTFVVRSVGIRSGFQQDLEGGWISGAGGDQVQGRVAVMVAHLGIRPGSDQVREDCLIAVPCGPMQGGLAIFVGWGAKIGAGRQEQGDNFG